MTPEEWTALLKIIGSTGLGGLVGALVASLFLRSYAAKFLEEKAKIAATKSDIDELKGITRALKGVEHEYNENIEQTRLRHQLRLAALDRRLQAHQEAYAICRHLVIVAQGVHHDESLAALARFQEWWSANCLYLTPEASRALYATYAIAPRFRSIEERTRGAEADEAWQTIIGAETIVAREAGTILGTETHLTRSTGEDA